MTDSFLCKHYWYSTLLKYHTCCWSSLSEEESVSTEEQEDEEDPSFEPESDSDPEHSSDSDSELESCSKASSFGNSLSLWGWRWGSSRGGPLSQLSAKLERETGSAGPAEWETCEIKEIRIRSCSWTGAVRPWWPQCPGLRWSWRSDPSWRMRTAAWSDPGAGHAPPPLSRYRRTRTSRLVSGTTIASLFPFLHIKLVSSKKRFLLVYFNNTDVTYLDPVSHSRLWTTVERENYLTSFWRSAVTDKCLNDSFCYHKTEWWATTDNYYDQVGSVVCWFPV